MACEPQATKAQSIEDSIFQISTPPLYGAPLRQQLAESLRFPLPGFNDVQNRPSMEEVLTEDEVAVYRRLEIQAGPGISAT